MEIIITGHHIDMKWYLVLLLNSIVCCWVSGQGNRSQMNIYELGGFQIVPAEKTIYGQQMTGGTDYDKDGNAIHWDGYEYVPLRDIDYETTTLIIAGDAVTFKEYFQIRSVDPSLLKVLHVGIGYDNNYMTLLSPSEKKVYVKYTNGVFSNPIDVRHHTHVTGNAFKNKQDELFFIPLGGDGLVKVDIPIDLETLEHVVADYYADKNGLYHFGYGRFQSEMLIASSGKIIQPVLYETHFVYGEAAFPSYGWAPEKWFDLQMNARKLSVIKTNYGTYLTDDKKIYIPSKSKSTAVGKLSSMSRVIQAGMPSDPVYKWNVFDIIVIGGNKKGNTVYYSSKEIYAGSGGYYTLIKTPSGYYGATGSSARLEAQKFDDIMIYNADIQKYESIEVDRFRRITSNFYLYKNKLYNARYSYPVRSELDLEKLDVMKHHGKPTQFYTDGKYLLAGYNLGRMKEVKSGTQTCYEFSEPLFQQVDWQTLSVASSEMLVDKNNLYLSNSDGLFIIPLKGLGLRVVVLAETWKK